MRSAPVIAACSLALFAAGISFFFFRPLQKASDVPLAIVTTSPIATTTEQAIGRTVPEGMREYRSVAYHFSLFYPQELAVSEHAEEGGAVTITFQNIEKAEGFQIYIVSYDEPQVSDERFRQDEPSGVRESMTNIVIDGATGASFFSINLALGDTAELWFVHGGYLYEVTTLKPLAGWLDGIIQTWRFI